MTPQSGPLRITHITKTLDSAAGGLPVVAMRLAAAAVESGHKVTLVAEKPAVDLTHECLSIPGFAGVEVRFCRPFLLRNLFHQSVCHAELNDTVKRSDVVHLHGVWDLILVLSTKIARRCGVPYFITPHGMLDPWSLTQSRLKKVVALQSTHRSFLANAAALHALNEEEATLWSPLKLSPSTCVIPNGVDLREIPPFDSGRENSLRHRFGLRNKKTILFLSRLHFKKGLDVLADAFRRVAARRDDVDLLVVGPDGGAKSSFEAAILAAGLSDRVHVVGPLFGNDKFDAMRLADVFCLPSRQEGFSIAILEALACGTPVIISRDCHFDAVETAGVGRVCKLNADLVADALLDVLGSVSLRDSMSRASTRWVAENYTWKRSNELLIDLYRRCIESDSNPPNNPIRHE